MTRPCECGDAIGASFPLLACGACGQFARHVSCAACDHEAPFREWLDSAKATPALRRAAEDCEVRLAAAVTPRFLERCVVCNRARVSGTLQLTSRSSTWLRRLLDGWFIALFVAVFVARRVVVEAPACPPCSDRFGRGRFYRWLLTWGLALATYVVARAGLDGDLGPSRLIAVGAWGTGWFAARVVLRSAIAVVVEGDDDDDGPGIATYTFDHAPYAVEFARLNGA